MSFRVYGVGLRMLEHQREIQMQHDADIGLQGCIGFEA